MQKLIHVSLENGTKTNTTLCIHIRHCQQLTEERQKVECIVHDTACVEETSMGVSCRER